VTQKLKNQASNINGVFIVFVLSIGFALIPASIISFILHEREQNLKHMQLISGMSLSAYWVSNYIFDIIKALIPVVIVIGLMYAFNLNVSKLELNLTFYYSIMMCGQFT
jgi:ATP-binding cassette, subfamily A (ABC1), member 3